MSTQKQQKRNLRNGNKTVSVGTKSLVTLVSVGAFVVFLLWLTQLYHPHSSEVQLHADMQENTNTQPVSDTNTLASPVTEKKSAPLPRITQVVPADGATDVILDIEDPIRVVFDAPIQNAFVDFQIEPKIDVVYENNPEKTEFKLLPKQALARGVEYTLQISVKPSAFAQEITQRLGTVRFTTLADTLTEPQKELYKKMQHAKMETQPKITEGKYIDVNLATQTMVIFEDGIALDAYLVSSGKRGMDTPKGSYSIHNKAPRPWSKQYSLYMPNWMAFTASGKYGIHELPEWPSGYKEGASHLGRPVSHGCVRLGVGPSKRVYDFAEVGTPVIVH